MSEVHPDFQLAASRVPDIARDLNLSPETEAHAIQLAERASLTHPINHKPTVTAGGAIYAAGLLENEKRTQHEVAGAADVGTPSIRSTYQEILDAEGIGTARHRQRKQTHKMDRWRPFSKRVVQSVIRFVRGRFRGDAR